MRHLEAYDSSVHPLPEGNAGKQRHAPTCCKVGQQPQLFVSGCNEAAQAPLLHTQALQVLQSLLFFQVLQLSFDLR